MRRNPSERHALRGSVGGVKAVAIVMLYACAAMPHVDSKPRTDVDAARATVTVHVSCSSADPFPAGHEYHRTPSTNWYANRGTGVAISERHVLTAAHVIAPCPDIPRVSVTLPDGRSFRVFVERRDIAADIVRLEIVSGSTFRRFIAPPALGSSDGIHYHVATRRGVYVGERHAFDKLGPGDSGAGVYAHDGSLVGLLLGEGIRITRVDATWMEGT